MRDWERERERVGKKECQVCIIDKIEFREQRTGGCNKDSKESKREAINAFVIIMILRNDNESQTNKKENKKNK